MLRILTLGALVLCSVFLTAQTDHRLLLTSGVETPAANLDTYLRTAEIAAGEVFDGYYLRLVQFETLPNAATQRAIAAANVQLLEYLPRNAYVVGLPEGFALDQLRDWQVRHVRPLSLALKASSDILGPDLPAHALRRNRVAARIRIPAYVSSARAQEALRALGLTVTTANPYTQHVGVRVPRQRITELATQPFVQYLDVVSAPGTPEDLPARALHRNNQIDTDLPGPRQYDGTGVNILVRDDGEIGPHIDFRGRLDDTYLLAAGGTHGDMVAGVAAGGGNLNPDIRGAATGAYLYTFNYEPDYNADATMTVVMENGVVLTNSSYSDGCNAGYNLSSIAVDEQVAENSQLMHVFSAGNSNNNDCGYGAGDQWGNITGGHKQGKNVIATANLTYESLLRNSSSRGPSADGRIKPDIAANGHDQLATDPDNTYAPGGGTSAAAPSVMGTLAQLYQAYRELTGEANPPGGLMKAALLNTAYDLGNPGPDFRFGWGRVDALNALELLEDERYLTAAVNQGENNTHSITVPAGVAELRVMTYWTDPAGSANASIALVNDLNTLLTAPDGSTHQPLVLDPTPDTGTLNAPAEPGTDNLNNVEQVRLAAPPAGTYTLDVTGFAVPMGAQTYYVLYEFVSDEIEVTHPVGGEHFIPGASIPVHWNAYGNTEPFFVEYSLDNGVSWLPAGSNVAANRRQVDFTMPGATTGAARIRITRGGQSSMSPAPFHIASRPSNVSVTKVCPNIATLTWNAVSNATAYDVYVLGDTHMDSVGTTTTNSIEVPIGSPIADNWFAVRARGGDQVEWISQRTIAVQQPAPGLLDCPQENDLAAADSNLDTQGLLQVCGSTSQEVVLTINNAGLNDQSVFYANYQVDNGAIISDTLAQLIAPGDDYVHTFAEPIVLDSDALTVKAWVATPLDSVAFNDTLRYALDVVLYTDAVAADLVQDFESGSIDGDWTTFNPDGSLGWEVADSDFVIGSDGNPTAAAYVNNFDYSDEGQLDYLTSTLYDLGDLSDPVLAFDLAYSPYSATYNDRLLVEISGDCGMTYTTIYDKAYEELQTTAGSSTAVFIPTGAEDWRRELISVADYAGQEVFVRFVNVTGWGNTLFLDNINFGQVLPPSVSLTSNTTEVCQNQLVFLQADVQGEGAVIDWQFPAGTGNTNTADADGAQITFGETGTQTVSLIVTNPAGADTASVVFEVAPLPVSAFSSSTTDDVTFQFVSTSTDADNYLWDFGDGVSSALENPTHTYTEGGTYTVELTVMNDCGTRTSSQPVDVLLTSVGELPSATWTARVSPNPSDGNFVLQIENDRPLDVRYTLHDLRGRALRQATLTAPATLRFSEGDLPGGVYFLQLTTGDYSQTLRVVID